MNTKNKTILASLITFLVIGLYSSHALAEFNILDRVVDDSEEGICSLLSDGWILCFAGENKNFEVVDGVAKFPYILVPSQECDTDSSKCPQLSFVQFFFSESLAPYWLSSDPKQAQLIKDPITQCGEAPDPGQIGLKVNYKVDFKKIQFNELRTEVVNPPTFSISFDIGKVRAAETCFKLSVVSSSDCDTHRIIGMAPVANTIGLNSDGVDTQSCGDINVDIQYEEGCGSTLIPTEIKPQDLNLCSRLINNPHIFAKEKVTNNPRKRAFAVQNLGGSNGTLVCTDTYPVFAWSNKVYFIEYIDGTNIVGRNSDGSCQLGSR
jgi:hypothetical protein